MADEYTAVFNSPQLALVYGIQLNQGAKLAAARYSLFVHADLRLTQKNIVALQKATGQASGRLYYFDLSFVNKSSR